MKSVLNKIKKWYQGERVEDWQNCGPYGLPELHYKKTPGAKIVTHIVEFWLLHWKIILPVLAVLFVGVMTNTTNLFIYIDKKNQEVSTHERKATTENNKTNMEPQKPMETDSVGSNKSNDSDLQASIVSKIGSRYVRQTSGNDEATIDVKRISDEWSTSGEQIQVKGFALYGTDTRLHPRGPNIGDIDFVGKMENGRIKYSEKINGRTYRIELIFTRDGLEINEELVPGRYGVGVSFAGTYKKQGDIQEVVNSAK